MQTAFVVICAHWLLHVTMISAVLITCDVGTPLRPAAFAVPPWMPVAVYAAQPSLHAVCRMHQELLDYGMQSLTVCDHVNGVQTPKQGGQALLGS